MNRKICVLTLAVAAFLQLVKTKRATATLLAYDSFSGRLGTLHGQTGGTGFGNAWNIQGIATVSNCSVVAGSLAILGYSGVGNSATLSGTNQEVVERNLSSTYGISGTDLWFSFMERINSLTNY